MQNKKYSFAIVKQLGKIVLSILFLVIIFLRIDFVSVSANIASLSLQYLLFAGAVYLFSVIVLALKWWILIPDSSYKQLLIMTYIGIFYSMLIPGQIFGDGIKAYKLSKITGNGVAIGYSVLLDKIIGFLMIILIVIIGFLFSDIEIGTIYKLFVGFLFLSLLLALVAIVKPVAFNIVMLLVNRMITNKVRVKEKVQKICSSIESSINDIRFSSILLNSIFGLIYLIVCIVSNIIILYGFGYVISFFDWLWITGALVLVVLIPISIGGLGLREGSLIVFLGFFGVPSEIAFSVSIIGFSYQLINVLIGFALNIRNNTHSDSIIF